MKIRYLFLCFVITIASSSFSQKIQLVKEQLLPLTHFDFKADYGKLVDGVKGLDNSLTYTPTESSSTISWPHKVLIDLRGIYNITQLKAYDGYSSPTINWYAGTTPFNTTLIAGPISLTGYDTYNVQNVTANGVRYIILEQIDNLSRFPSEIEVYGTATSIIAPVIAAKRPIVEAKDLLGADGFFTEDPNIVGIYTNYRLYVNTDWFFNSNQELMLSPANQGGVNVKEQLTAFKSRGTESVVTLQNSPNYILNKSATEHDPNYKATSYNITNYTTPASWLDISKAYYRIAGYLGRQQVSNTDMNFNTTPRWTGDLPNKAESGLNLANYMEVLNEPDKNWTFPTEAGYYSPYTLASFMSAAYDGHQGTMQKAGIKTADPSMKVVMGGLFKLQVEYIQAMHEWAKYNRPDGKFPADVINFHHYNSNESTGLQDGSGTATINPEQGELFTQMEKIIDYRNKYLPDVEIWLSEWGHSTNMGVFQVPNLPSYGTKEDVQGAWIIRTYLSLMKLNIDKSHLYANVDEFDHTNDGMFGTCGIFKYNTLEKKRSYYYVTDFINLFKEFDYKLKADLSTASVRDYVFEDLAAGKEMRFVWSPTSTETTIPNYNVNIVGSDIKGFQFTGGTHSINNYPNSNSITVTETPRVFIYNTDALAVNENINEELTLYPNPTSGKVYFNANTSKIALFNLNGSLLEEFSTKNKASEIDLTNYPTGIYYLNITNEDSKTVIKKIVKQE